jgi:hypothetical protein
MPDCYNPATGHSKDDLSKVIAAEDGEVDEDTGNVLHE